MPKSVAMSESVLVETLEVLPLGVPIEFESIQMTLNWLPSVRGSDEHDMDAAAFLLTEDGQVPEDRFFVFYNNPASPDGAARLNADHRMSNSGRAAEILTIDLTKLAEMIKHIVFTASLYKGDLRNQTFGDVERSCVSISDPASHRNLCRYDLNEDFAPNSAVEVACLTFYEDRWHLQAVGEPRYRTLNSFVLEYARNYAADAEAEPPNQN